jgi:predicted acetyltransferase
MTKDLILKGVETDEELAQANDLMAKAHFQDFFEAMRWLKSSGTGYPDFSAAHTRIAVCNGEVAAALRLTSDTIRVGEARLKMGGLGWVTTAGHHRHKGLARELISDTMRYMRTQNYHVSMLFGIPNFYHRFGFVTALPEYETSVLVSEASAVGFPAYRMRPGKPGDIRLIQKIHHAGDESVACSLLRSAAHITNKWERWKAVRVLTDDHGKVLAYFLPRTTEEELHVEEVGVTDWASCGTLLHACAAMAIEECVGRVRFSAPPGHLMIRYLLRYRSHHTMRITRDEGGMMALVHLGETLESMIPEWENRLVRSAASELHTEVTLIIDRKPYRVRAHRGAIDVTPASGTNKVSLSSADLLHLLSGYRYLEEVLAARRRIITADGHALLGALFPKRTPYVWLVDRF